MDQPRQTDRRDFIKLAGAATAITALGVPRVFGAAGNNHKLQIALIGCGGRGTGAVVDALLTVVDNRKPDRYGPSGRLLPPVAGIEIDTGCCRQVFVAADIVRVRIRPRQGPVLYHGSRWVAGTNRYAAIQ